MAIIPVGFEGQVNEQPFAKMMNAVGGYGILGTVGGTNFAAARVAGSRTVTVQPGTIWAPGVLVTVDAVTTPTAVATNSSGSNRIDMLVMRVNWTTDTCALMILVGGTSPPSYNLNPGTLYDIPLYKLVLPPGAGEYTDANIAAGDIRTWLVDGNTAIAGDTLPDTFPGRLWMKPFDGEMLLGGFGSETSTFKAEKVTGVSTIMGAPSGFTGVVRGWQLNGIAEVEFSWTRTAGTITNLDIDTGPFPAGWRPKYEINRQLFAINTAIRVGIPSDGGLFRLNNVTISNGNNITGGFTYIVGS